jgi:hypothetical protein
MGRNIQVVQFGVKQVGQFRLKWEGQYGVILSPGIHLLFCKPAIEGAAGVYFVEIAAMHKTELLKVIKK